MNYSQLCPRAKKSWLFSAIFAGVIYLAAVLITYTQAFSNGTDANIFLIVALSCVVALLIFQIIYNIYRYKGWSFFIDENQIVSKSGVFFKTTDTIPVLRLQHIQLIAGPIERIYKMASIKFCTAGSEHTIPCLDRARAEEIVAQVNARLDEKIAVEIKEKGDV